MQSIQMRVTKSPCNDIALSNCIACNPSDFNTKKHVVISTQIGQFVYTVYPTPSIKTGELGFSYQQRKWSKLPLNDTILVQEYKFQAHQYVIKITLEVDLYSPTHKAAQEPLDTKEMAREFSMQFQSQAFTRGQPLAFNFNSYGFLKLYVKEMFVADIEALQSGSQPKKMHPHHQIGLVQPNTEVYFEKAIASQITLVGENLSNIPNKSIIDPNCDFTKMGVGGCDKEIAIIFSRAFASRIFPPTIIKQLGVKHVRGILLFGPPGTGKTLIARQISQMVNAREPKIVSGPQILDKYVGESEANIRKLFSDAEDEQKEVGEHSALHVIIFDEMDAICKQRGSVSGNTGVNDSIVNQLLSKMDGVDQLNNILVIGMTNRLDMIDDALLRPGRFEVQIEINLPDEKGRVQIFKIHTEKMSSNHRLESDVNLEELAKRAKNFTGAEIEGLCRAATAIATNRCYKIGKKVEFDCEAADKLKVSMNDFLNALENDIKPAFGQAEARLEHFIQHGIFEWSESVKDILQYGRLFCELAKELSLLRVLISGPPESGKTAIAASICKNSAFTFVKAVSPEDMIGFTERASIAYLNKIFTDAYRSKFSCILVDNIECIIEYSPVGPVYSNSIAKNLAILLKKEPPKDCHLLIVTTTCESQILRDLGRPEHVVDALILSESFPPEDIAKIQNKIANSEILIGIKKLFQMVQIAKKNDPLQWASKFIAYIENDEAIMITDGEF